MKLISLLFSLCLLINSSKCGPEIFKFTSQPVSQTVNPGGSVTLSCVATGRSGITYSWYRLDKDFLTPPSDLKLISGEVNTNYVVQAADVDDSGEERLFQCKAAARSDIILSNVATVLYKLSDSIEFDNSGSIYNAVKSIPNDLNDAGVYLYRLPCNVNVVKFDDVIKNGEPYDVQWFKTGESGRVEDNHDNMWTNYHKTDLNSYKVDVAGSESSVSPVKQYDLFIFNVRTSDAGTYSCKAVSRVNKQEVLLGSTDLTVGTENTGLAIYPKEIITGYMVLAVDSAGKITSAPKVGDEVLLMCGVACRTSSGSLDPQYQWKDSSGTVIANTREHVVTLSSTGSVTYTCVISNSECTSKLSSAEKSVPPMTVLAAEFDPTLQFTFSSSPPEYMWYDTSDDSKSHDPFEIGCQGSYSSGNSDVGFVNSVLRIPVTVASFGKDVVFDFGSIFSSDKSGVYQCVMFNNPDIVVLYQQTTNVVIAAPASAAINPTIMSVSSESTATFTCTVGGYPLKSVIISGPNNVNIDCLTTQTSGDVGCSSSDKSNYVVKVQNFKLEYSGDYICTVNTKWYKDDNIAAIEDSAQDNVALYFESTTILTASTNPANKGTKVTLTCIVKGNPAPSNPVLTKTVDGSSSDVSMTCSGTTTTKTCEKTFSSVEFTDSGEYLCSGENTIDGVKKKSSSQLALNIVGNAEASLTRTPAGSELAKDASVTFTCSIIGSPRPSKLTLKKGDVVLKSYDAAEGADSDIVTTKYGISYTHDISTLALDDTAVYTCKGENDNGGVKTDEDTTNLTVVSDVKVTLSSSTTTPTFGDTFTITCTATGGRKPHSVKLQHDDNTITAADFTCTSEGDYTDKCLYSSTADYTSGGTYSCTGKNRVAGNVEKEDTKTVTISLSKSVSVSLTPASGTPDEVTFGTTYTITCNVDGGDKPHKVTLNIPDSTNDLTWERDGQGNTLTCSGEFELSCEHQISKIAYSQEGAYTCIGYNKLPATTTDLTDTKTVSLVVVKDVTVYLSVDPATAEISHGTEIKITCVADGGRIPYFLEFSHTSISSTVSKLVTYDTTTSSTPATVTVDKTANTLTYVYTVAEADYEDNGSYSCISKNRASSNAERENEKTASVLVVKSVEIETIPNIEADYGTSFTFTFKLNGGRSPHSVKLKNTKSQIFDWSGNSNECTGTNELSCSKTVEDSDVNFGYDGDYTVTAKNRALNNAVVTASKTFTVTVYRDVSAKITPSSDSKLTYHVDTNITCNVIGGLPPHKVDLILPNQVTKTWTKDGSGNSLTCTGTHDKTCTHTFTPEYNSDGSYKCVGYNKVMSNEEKQKESTVVHLTTVRSTEVSISNTTVSVLTNGTVDVHCTIVGKPLVDMSAVSWRHNTLTVLDWSKNVTTVKGSEDDYTLVSTLTLINPSTNYSGSFNCNVQTENSQVISKSVVVSINNREYLDAPVVSHDRGEATEQDVDMSVTCLVEGFPRPSATLTYKNLIDGEESRTISGASRIISPTSTEYKFKLSTSCEYSQYYFTCETQTTRNSDNRVLTQSSSIEGPIVNGCENALPVIIGGGVGGGVAFIAIAVIAVFFILKKVKTSRNKEYSPKNGTQIPNPAFGADPSYATVRETPGAIGYSHLNRPVGDTTEDGYACIGQMSKQTGQAPAADAYATLDTASNGRMGLQRQGSDAAYAALNRPAPGKEKRGVIRKYKPIASRPKSTLGPPPNKAPDIEMGAITGGDQPEPTYATVNPQTKKVKENTSNYTDIPDLPPEVPVYGQGVLKKADPSEYADVTLPPPPPLPDGPIYSNMTERQGAVMDEDPVYAQVDIKSRTAKKQPAEEEEDLPPEVPIYGTMGACTEPDDEDPYATVEFIPKSKRKPPRPKAKEDESEGLYATITDFKENP